MQAKQQLADLKFAFAVVKHVKSNAIVIAKDSQLLGMGAGQPNRVASVRLAVAQAGLGRAMAGALCHNAGHYSTTSRFGRRRCKGIWPPSKPRIAE